MEQAIFTIKPSLKPIILLYALALLVAIFAVLAKSFVTLVAGLIAFVAFAEVSVMHLQRNFTIYTLTFENIKVRTGIIGKKEVVVPLAKIQNVASDFTPLQRIFGIGNVTVESAATATVGTRLRNIDKPEETAKKILGAAKSQKPGQV